MRARSATAMLLACALGAPAAIPTQPSWAQNPGTPAEEDAGKIKDRYYANLVLPSGELLRMWYVEASRTSANRQSAPMGAMTGSIMAPYNEMHRPADFRRYPFDSGQWAEGYAVEFEHDLWVADTEVSMRVWNEVMVGAPAGWPASGAWVDADNDGRHDVTGFVDYKWDPTSEDPVVFVTQRDAWRFCTQLASGLTLGNHELELPTEAEWEFFARAIDAPDAGNPWPPHHDDWTWGGVASEVTPHEEVVEVPSLQAGVSKGLVREGESYDSGSTPEGTGWSDVGGSGIDGAYRVRYRDLLVGSWICDQRHLLYGGDGMRWEALRPGHTNPYHGTNAQRYTVRDLRVITVPNPAKPSEMITSWEMDLDVARITYRRWNAFGITHVGGNVAEWVADSWDGASPYNTLPAGRSLAGEAGTFAARMPDVHGSLSEPADGHRANTRGHLAVTRGGSWLNGNRECRPSSRAGMDPLTFNDQVGFRFIIRAVP